MAEKAEDFDGYVETLSKIKADEVQNRTVEGYMFVRRPNDSNKRLRRKLFIIDEKAGNLYIANAPNSEEYQVLSISEFGLEIPKEQKLSFILKHKEDDRRSISFFAISLESLNKWVEAVRIGCQVAVAQSESGSSFGSEPAGEIVSTVSPLREKSRQSFASTPELQLPVSSVSKQKFKPARRLTEEKLENFFKIRPPKAALYERHVMNKEVPRIEEIQDAKSFSELLGYNTPMASQEQMMARQIIQELISSGGKSIEALDAAIKEKQSDMSDLQMKLTNAEEAMEDSRRQRLQLSESKKKTQMELFQIYEQKQLYQPMIKKAIRSGMLQKYAKGSKALRRRYFVLKDSLLYYFRNTNDKEPRCIIVLDGAKVERMESTIKNKYQFSLKTADNSEFVMFAQSEKDYEDWIKRISEVIEERDVLQRDKDTVQRELFSVTQGLVNVAKEKKRRLRDEDKLAEVALPSEPDLYSSKKSLESKLERLNLQVDKGRLHRSKSYHRGISVMNLSKEKSNLKEMEEINSKKDELEKKIKSLTSDLVAEAKSRLLMEQSYRNISDQIEKLAFALKVLEIYRSLKEGGHAEPEVEEESSTKILKSPELYSAEAVNEALGMANDMEYQKLSSACEVYKERLEAEFRKNMELVKTNYSLSSQVRELSEQFDEVKNKLAVAETELTRMKDDMKEQSLQLKRATEVAESMEKKLDEEASIRMRLEVEKQMRDVQLGVMEDQVHTIEKYD